MIDIRRASRAVAGVAMLLGATALGPGGVAASSCSGAAHVMGLSGGTVSPGAGTKSTLLDFTVVYRDNGDCFPDRIVVVVHGAGEVPLTKISGELVTGATFGVAIRLPKGTWGYHFEAASGWGNGERTAVLQRVAPVVVRIAPENVAPTPTPEADPDPPWLRPTATAAAGGGAGSIGGNGSDSGLGAGDIARSLVALPVALAGTLVGLGLFLALGRRVVGFAPIGGLELVGGQWRRSQDLPAPGASMPAAPPPPIAATARPRPPAVLPARGASIARPPITFAKPPVPGVDRCRVTARHVPLTSMPGDRYGRQRGRLEPGDEVDVIRQEGHYCLVRTPSGVEGWILGLAIVGMPATAGSEGPDA